jgi:hypothetical protein
MATQIVSRTSQPSGPPPPAPQPPPAEAYYDSPPPRRRGVKPLMAAALGLGGGALGVLLGVVLLATADESGDKRVTGPTIAVTDEALPTRPRPGATPTPAQGPIRGPGYKMTATFTEPPNLATPLPFDRRIFDAIIVGVQWDDAWKLYNRRYPMSFLWNITTTNLLLAKHEPEDAKRLLVNAGYPNNGPKIHLAFNPGDNVFATWLTGQLRNLGLIVVTDTNQFTAEEKQKGYYGLIIDVLPA